MTRVRARRPQGLTFAPDGTLYQDEYGPNTDDEVNILRKGGNYGWFPSLPRGSGYGEAPSRRKEAWLRE